MLVRLFWPPLSGRERIFQQSLGGLWIIQAKLGAAQPNQGSGANTPFAPGATREGLREQWDRCSQLAGAELDVTCHGQGQADDWFRIRRARHAHGVIGEAPGPSVITERSVQLSKKGQGERSPDRVAYSARHCQTLVEVLTGVRQTALVHTHMAKTDQAHDQGLAIAEVLAAVQALLHDVGGRIELAAQSFGEALHGEGTDQCGSLIVLPGQGDGVTEHFHCAARVSEDPGNAERNSTPAPARHLSPSAYTDQVDLSGYFPTRCRDEDRPERSSLSCCARW